MPIPVMRPQLPDADRLLPYLRRIDSTRVYSNWGPLCTEFAARLASTFGVASSAVVCANSGMAALAGAILASAGEAKPHRGLALIPDFTFTATGLAVRQCGYEPLLASSDAATWTFSPADLLARPELLAQVGLVVPVAAFGRMASLAEWSDFRSRTGIPVVYDAAASFEALQDAGRTIGSVPVVVSFHATKTFGTGEGGCVIANDADLAARVVQCLNFGFAGSRISALPAFNGKMPEYTAAVGLAELDGWPVKRDRFRAVAAMYRESFARADISRRLWTSPDISGCYAILECASSSEAHDLASGLAAKGVESRLWYGHGLAEHDVFRDSPRAALHANALESARFLGLPVAVDMTRAQVDEVAAAAAIALRR